MEQNQFDIKKVQVHRTTEGTVFEVAFVILAIIVWGLITWMIHRAPDIVPTHFDAFGKPNAYGSPSGIIIPCIVLTIGAVICMAIAISHDTSICLSRLPISGRWNWASVFPE